MKCKHLCFVAILLVLCSGLAYPVNLHRITIGVSGGINWTNPNKLSNLRLYGETDHLHPNNSHPAFTSLLRIAYTFSRHFSAGINWHYFYDKSSGDVWQYGMQEFDNYDYNLGLGVQHFFVDGQYIFSPLLQRIYPFIDIGVGVARIKSSYEESPKPPHTEHGGEVNLPSKAEWNMAYNIGMGIKSPISNNFNFTLSYFYSYFGRHSTSKDAGDKYLSHPIAIDLRSHTILVGFEYLLNL